MSVQWVGVAGLLYVELAITLLLLIPFLKPATWKRILNLPLFGTIQTAWTTLFYAALLILIVLFADSIRTMMKYKELPVNSNLTLDAKLDYQFKECRGQRNFYISGFTLFLILVIRRLITLIYQRAHLEAEVTAIRRQAEQANRELQRRLQDDDQEGGKGKDKPKSKPSQKEAGEGEEKEKTEVETVGPSQEEYDQLKKELHSAQTDLEAMKKQAQSTNAEYDRLAEQYQKLQATLQEQEGQGEEKKDV